jgi:hypothetical protein
MSGVFGKAKFGSAKRNWFKLKDGDATFRILPPMGDLGEDGRWSVFYNIHYGYRNSKNEMRTFQSPLVKNRKTKMIEVPDAALDRINGLKVKLEEAKKAGDQERIAQILKLVGGQKSRYNLDSNHYVNVVDLQGNIGILKIRHRAKLALDAQIKRLRDNGVDPLDAETGRFFTFSRSGNATETLYQVNVFKKRINVPGVGDVEQEVVHVIDSELAKRCLVQNKDGSFTYREAGRLDQLFKAPTAAEVERIVKEGESAVDEILDAKTESATAGTEPSDSEQEDPGMEEESAPTTAAPAVAQAQQNAAPVPAATLQSAPVAAQVNLQTTTLAPTPVAPTPVAPAQAATPAAPKTTAQAVNEQTDAEFLKSLGL